MPRPEADWKNQPRHAFDWLSTVLGVVLISLYSFLWLSVGRIEYSAMALFFATWLVLFFSPYWQPILYVLASVVVIPYTVYGLFTDLPSGTLVILALVLNCVFVALVLFLFFREERGR